MFHMMKGFQKYHLKVLQLIQLINFFLKLCYKYKYKKNVIDDQKK